MTTTDLEKLTQMLEEDNLRKYGSRESGAMSYGSINNLSLPYTLKLSMDYIRLSSRHEFFKIKETMKKEHGNPKHYYHPPENPRYSISDFSIKHKGHTSRVLMVYPMGPLTYNSIKIMQPNRNLILHLSNIIEDKFTVRECEFSFDFHVRKPNHVPLLNQFIFSHLYVSHMRKSFYLNPDFYPPKDSLDSLTLEKKGIPEGFETRRIGDPRMSSGLSIRLYEKPKFDSRKYLVKMFLRMEVVAKRRLLQKHALSNLKDLLSFRPENLLDRIAFKSFDLDRLAKDTNEETSKDVADLLRHEGLTRALPEIKQYVANPYVYLSEHPFHKTFRNRVARYDSFLR